MGSATIWSDLWFKHDFIQKKYIYDTEWVRASSINLYDNDRRKQSILQNVFSSVGPFVRGRSILDLSWRTTELCSLIELSVANTLINHTTEQGTPLPTLTQNHSVGDTMDRYRLPLFPNILPRLGTARWKLKAPLQGLNPELLKGHFL